MTTRVIDVSRESSAAAVSMRSLVTELVVRAVGISVGAAAIVVGTALMLF